MSHTEILAQTVLKLSSGNQIHKSWHVTLGIRSRSPICNPNLSLTEDHNHVQYQSPSSNGSGVIIQKLHTRALSLRF